MIRYFLEMVSVPPVHQRICEQLQRRYHIIMEEYPGKNIDHVLSGIREIIVRLPTAGYTENELIVELYRMHLRYVQKIHLPFALIEAYHMVPLLHWSVDEHLFLQLANELEQQRIYRYLLEKNIPTECLHTFYQTITLPECDIGAMKRSFLSKPSSAILHRYIYTLIALQRTDDDGSKDAIFKLTLLNKDLSFILHEFSYNLVKLSYQNPATPQNYILTITRKFMQSLGQWNLEHMLCN
jgi:hypothetical protein